MQLGLALADEEETAQATRALNKALELDAGLDQARTTLARLRREHSSTAALALGPEEGSILGASFVLDPPAAATLAAAERAGIESAIRQRKARAAVLWIDEPDRPHDWQVPRALKEAMRGCDVFINHSFKYVTEENRPLRDHFMECGVRYVRNFATTAALLIPSS